MIMGKSFAGVGRGHIFFGIRRVADDMIKRAKGNIRRKLLDVTVTEIYQGKPVGFRAAIGQLDQFGLKFKTGDAGRILLQPGGEAERNCAGSGTDITISSPIQI